MFCLGAFAVMAQVMFMREMLVVFFGNELSIGVILASWLVNIGIGAFCGRHLLRFFTHVRSLRRFAGGLFVVSAAVLPVQIHMIRTIRGLLDVPVGEYTPLGAILISALAVFFPSCFTIGLVFPLVCQALALAEPAGERARVAPASLVYTFEALGSMVGGVVLTYALLPFLTPWRIVVLAGAIPVVGAAALTVSRPVRLSLFVLSMLLAAAGLLYPAWLKQVERTSIEARWRGFGVLPEDPASPGVQLVDTEDTVYQNLALMESEGQFALYGNGQLMSVFPDPIEYEHAVHFVMAQKPAAGRVLLLGGNPVGEVPELLKYPIARLVYVEIDPGIGRVIRRAADEAFDRILSDPRVKVVAQDAPRYVRRCRERFDVIFINAPEPVTASANRFYTLEFYRSIDRILAEGGFISTAVSSSERLQSEALDLGASVYRTLRHVFPVVLVTAEARNRFLAARTPGHGGGLTFDRETLTARSRSAGIHADFFRPEFFLGADEIAPDKVQYVEGRFSSTEVPLNTNLRPVTFFYNLVLWSRFSGSRVESLLGWVGRLRWWGLACFIVALGVACLAVGAGLGLLRRAGLCCSDGAMGKRWARLMAATLIATTGFCGMALEIVLVFLFQSLHGYVYTRMGVIVAAFMLGLVVGAPSGKAMAAGGERRGWLCLAGLELLLMALAVGVPGTARAAHLPGLGGALGARFGETLIYAVVVLIGWSVGAEFPLGNRVFCNAGGTAGVAAAVTDASDHLGAAAGCLLIGIVLVPVMGIGASCLVLAALKLGGLLCLGSAALAIPRCRE